MRKIWLIPLLLILGACSILPKPAANVGVRYALAPVVAAPVHSGVRCPLVLRVRSIEAAPPYAGDALVYTKTPLAVAEFAYHRWAAPPASMLTRDLVGALGASGLYRGVLGPTDPGSADLTLAVHLTRGPVQVFPGLPGTTGKAPSSSTEVLSISAVLANAVNGKLIATHRFSGARRAQPDPYAGVVMANRLAGELIGRLTNWLAGINPTLDCRVR